MSCLLCVRQVAVVTAVVGTEWCMCVVCWGCEGEVKLSYGAKCTKTNYGANEAQWYRACVENGSLCTSYRCWLLLVRLFVCMCVVVAAVPAGSPSRDGDVTVYVWHEPTELAHSFLFCPCVYFCLYGPFNCISVHKFSLFFILFFRSYPCIIGPFNYTSFYESPLQPWYNP